MARFPLLILSLLLSISPACGSDLPAVRLLLSNPAPYVGEEIVVTLEVRTAPRPQSAIVPIWPNLDNSASADLPTPPSRLEEGEAVLVQIMQRSIRPLRSGRLPLSSAGVTIAGQTYHALPVELRVLPLPEGGRPEGYAGAIGSITMRLEGEGKGSREIQLILSGEASLETFPAPIAELGSNERLILLDDTSVGTAPQERTRTLRYLYLPGGNARGELSFRLPVFDPQQGRYITHLASIRPFPLALVRSVYLLVILGLLYLLILYYRRSRTPRTIDAALERMLGRNPALVGRDGILQLLHKRRADPRLLIELEAHWQALDRLSFAPLPLRPPAFTAADEERRDELLLHLIRMQSWLRWLLIAGERAIKDQLRARMAKLSM